MMAIQNQTLWNGLAVNTKLYVQTTYWIKITKIFKGRISETQSSKPFFLKLQSLQKVLGTPIQ